MTISRRMYGTAILGFIACGLIAGSAAANVIIEDFSNVPLASYSGYTGSMVPSGSAHLTGWEIGCRRADVVDVGTDRLLSPNNAYAKYDLGVALAASSSEYQPVWDAAQASEAISLAGGGPGSTDSQHDRPVGPAEQGSKPPNVLLRHQYRNDCKCQCNIHSGIGTRQLGCGRNEDVFGFSGRHPRLRQNCRFGIRLPLGYHGCQNRKYGERIGADFDFLHAGSRACDAPAGDTGRPWAASQAYGVTPCDGTKSPVSLVTRAPIKARVMLFL